MTFLKHHLELMAVATLASACPLAARGGAPFTITELGTLGGAESVAYGLNDANQVVGWSHATNSEMHAFVWTNGSMADLGTLGGPASVAWAINNAGVVVGESLPKGQTGSTNFRAFVYQQQQMVPLATLGGTWSVAYDINENGTIAGLSYNMLQREQAVTWSAAGSITNIAQAGGATDQRTRAYGLNDAGVVTGWGYTPLGGPNNAFTYGGGQWTQIGGFGQFQNAEAYDIGNSGIVVGSSAPQTGGDWHAAIWLPANPTQAVILGTLPGFPLAELDDINSQNHAVGRAYITNFESRALYYDGQDLHDLNEFLPTGFLGELVDAREINESGAIAATARHNGLLRAVLLSPLRPGDVDHNGVVDVDDLIALILAWGPCPAMGPCPADFNGDLQVDVDDLIVVILNWG
jgi:probable HAF family extracellular repeat protein